MFDKVFKLKNLLGKKKELSKFEIELSTPRLSDQALIRSIYEWFREIHGDHPDWLGEDNSVQFRRLFIFIILYLYCPLKLANCGKMVKGLRAELCKVIGLSANTIVSNDCSLLLSEYKTYAKFRQSVEDAYRFILERLEKENL